MVVGVKAKVQCLVGGAEDKGVAAALSEPEWCSMLGEVAPNISEGGTEDIVKLEPLMPVPVAGSEDCPLDWGELMVTTAFVIRLEEVGVLLKSLRSEVCCCCRPELRRLWCRWWWRWKLWQRVQLRSRANVELVADCCCCCWWWWWWWWWLRAQLLVPLQVLQLLSCRHMIERLQSNWFTDE